MRKRTNRRFAASGILLAFKFPGLPGIFFDFQRITGPWAHCAFM